MTDIEINIEYFAKCPMLASDETIVICLRNLNRIFAKANKHGMSIKPLTDDEITDIEIDLIVGRLVGAFPGTDEPIIEACDKYIALLLQKGVPEALIPKRDPENPLKFLE